MSSLSGCLRLNKYSINKLRAIHEELQIYGVEAGLNKYVNY